MPLHPCPHCQRHVLAVETSCPFCSSELDIQGDPAVLPQHRLGRAALFAFGATLAAGLSTTACGSVEDGGTGGSGGSGATGGTGGATGGAAGVSGAAGLSGSGGGGFAGAAPEYGAPPPDGGGAGFSADYGAPPQD